MLDISIALVQKISILFFFKKLRQKNELICFPNKDKLRCKIQAFCAKKKKVGNLKFL